MVAPGPVARRRWRDAPAGQLQRRRHAGELPAPIGAILLIPIAEQVGLMPLHVRAERARRRQLGRIAATGRPIACGQFLQHDLLRIAIDDGVVERDRQQVLGLALAQQAGTDQRAVPGVHRPMVVVDEPLRDRRVAVGLQRAIDHGQTDCHVRQHALVLAVRLDHAAQRGMPVDDLLQRAGQRHAVQRAAKAQHGGGVVAEGRLVVDLALEPDAFLGRHQRIARGRGVIARRRLLEGLLEQRQLVELAQDRVGFDAEIDETADLVHADRLQPLDNGPACGRAADQRAALHIARVRRRQQIVAIVLAERAHVRLQAEAVHHVLEQAHRRLQVADERRAGNGACCVGILADKGMQQHTDPAALHAVAMLDQGPAIQREIALQFLDGLPHQVGENARADLASATIGIRIPHDGDPDRQLRLPGHREQLDLDLFGRTVPHPQGLAPPERLDLFDTLEHQLAMAAERLGREHEIVRVPAGSAGDAHPALREVVHHRPLFRDPHRMVQRQHDAARAQLDVRGFPRQCSAQHRRIGREPTEGMEMPLRQPQRRKAACIGIAGRLDKQPILVFIVVGRVVAEKRDAEADVAPGRRRNRRGRPPGMGALGRYGHHRHHGHHSRCPATDPRRRERRTAPAAGRRRRRAVVKEAAVEHGPHAVRENLDDPVHIRIAVRRGQEHAAAFPDIQAAREQMVVQQIDARRRFKQAERRAAMHRAHRHPRIGEDLVEAANQLGRARVERLLQRGALLHQPLQHRAGRHQHQRMLAEGARVEGRIRLRVRGIAVAPLAAVHRIEIGCRTGDHACRHPPADDLAVGRHIGLDAIPGLGTARMQAEAHDDVVEDQGDPVLARQLAQRLQELARLPVGAATLHRLHQHRGQLVRMLADTRQRFGRTVLEHDRVSGCARLQARCHRRGAGAIRHHQRVVAPAVIRAGEHDDLVAPGHRPGQTQGQHDRFGTGIAERHALQAGQPGDQLRHLAGEAGLGAELQAGLQLGIERLLHKVRAMAEQVHAEAHGQVDVGVAVRIPEISAFGALADHRVEHLLDGEPEAGRHPVVGQHRPVALHQRLGSAGALGIARDEAVQIGPLPRAQIAERIGLGGDLDRLEGDVRLVRTARCGGGCRRPSRCDHRQSSGHSGHDCRCPVGNRCRHTGHGAGCAPLEQSQLPGRQLRQRFELLAQQPLQRRLRDRGKRRHGFRPHIDRDRGRRRGCGRCQRRCRHRRRHHGSRLHRSRRLRYRLKAHLGGHLPIHVVRDGGNRRQLLEQLAHGDRHAIGLLDAADGLHHHQRVRAQLQQRQVRIDPRGIGMQHPGDHAAQGTLNLFCTAGGVGNGQGHSGGRHGSDGRDGTGRPERRLRIPEGSGGRIEPMAFALKGIRSKAQRAARLAGIEGAPVERLSRQPKLAGAAQQHCEIGLGVLAAAQRGQHEGLARAGAGQRAQRLPRAHLDPGGRSVLHQRLQAISKAHGAAQMRCPVAGIGGLSRLDPGTGEVGHEGNRRRPQGEPGHAARKGRQDRLSHVRVERVRSRQAPVRYALAVQPDLQRRDRRCLARHHAALAAVDRGQGQRPVQLRAQAGLVQRHAQHCTGGQALHQAAAFGNQREGVLEGEDPGQAGRNVFADAVADQRGRSHAPVHPQPGERVLDDEQRGLGGLGPVQRQLARLGATVVAIATAVERLDGIDPRSLAQHLRTPIHHGAERGNLLIQLAGHAHPLRTLPGKHEYHRCGRNRPHLRGEHAPGIARTQHLGRVPTIANHQHAPPRQGTATGLVGIGRIGQGGLRQGLQLFGPCLGHRFQCGGRLGGKAQQVPGPLRPLPGAGGRLRHDHMRQGAAEAERADAGMPAARVAGPGL